MGYSPNPPKRDWVPTVLILLGLCIVAAAGGISAAVCGGFICS